MARFNYQSVMMFKCVLKDVPILLSDLVGGLEHECYFSIFWECHHPN